MTTRSGSSARAGVALQPFLGARRLAELEAFYMFWVGSDPVPETRLELTEGLLRRMRATDVVRSRMKILTRPQREVVLAVVASTDYSVEKTAFLKGTFSDTLKSYQVDVAAQTLLKRGFLAEAEGGAVAIPRELGDIINRLYRTLERPPRALFSLAGFIESVKTDALITLYGRGFTPEVVRDRERVVEALSRPDAIRARVGGIEDSGFRSFLRTVVGQFGGILTRSLFSRINTHGVTWNLETFRTTLESNLLGTACFLNFEAFGIGLMEEGVVVFREVVDALLEENRPALSGFSRRVDLGVDVLSDIQRILSFVGRETVRFTQENSLYKTVHKRLENEMVLREVGRLNRSKVLDFLIDTMRERNLIRARPGKAVRPTPDGLLFGRLPLTRQLQQLLKNVLAAFPTQAGSFHHRSLLTLFLDRFRELEPDRWHDPMDLPFRARNAYLSELEDLSVQEEFKSRYEYASHPPREDPFQMAWRLYDLLTEWFLLFGLVEVGLQGDRIIAFRVTELGRRMLGSDAERVRAKEEAAEEIEGEGKPCLIVNPDFEVLLQPGPDTLEVTYFLDSFCERLHADHHLHFRLDRGRFQDLVGQGVSVDSILTTLEASARTPLPQNIAVMLRDWAGAVRFITANQVLLLECGDSEELDRLAELPDVKRAIHRRLGPGALALDMRKVSPELAESLRGQGFFLR